MIHVRSARALTGLAFVATLGLTAVPSAVTAEQYVVDYGDGYGQNVERDTGFLIGSVYVISTPEPVPTPSVIQTAPGEYIGGGYTYRAQTIGEQINDAARRHNVSAVCMHKIALRESGYDPTKVGDNGDSVGVFQFQLPLWSQTPQGRAGLSRFNAGANIEAAAWVMAQKGPNMGLAPWRGC